MNLSIRGSFFYSISPVLLLLFTGAHVSAVEKVQVSPPALSMKKGESKNLTLTGKNLSAAKSAGVFQKNSPKNQFTAKVTCKGATSCVVSLTLKAQVVAGDYSVKLFDAKKQPVAEGQFKLTPPPGKSLPRSGQSLRVKPKQTPPAGKSLPRPGQSLRAKPKQAPPKGKVIPRSGRSLKPKLKQVPPAGKLLPRSGQSLKPKPRQAPPRGKTAPRLGKGFKLPPQPAPFSGRTVPKSGQSRLQSKQASPTGKANPRSGRGLRPPPRQAPPKGDRSRKPGRTREKPSGLAELAGISLAPVKTGSGETVMGTITLTGNAPAPNGALIALSSSDSKIARVQPVQIPAGKNKANFSFKAGSVSGAVTITATLGKVSRVAELIVNAPPAGSKPDTRPADSTSGTSPVGSVPVSSFQPVIINTQALTSTGNGEGRQTTIPETGPNGVAFAPLTVTGGALSMTGDRKESVAFVPLTVTGGALSMTGNRQESVAFSPLTVTGGALSMTGNR